MNPLYAALAARRVFVLYKLVPLDNGGTDKVPIDPADGTNSNAQDDKTWMLPSVALGYAAMYGAGFGVGIVIHEGSGLFCLDLDGPKDTGGTLSDTDLKIVSDFAGCYIERSQSGKSLHIIGSYTGEAPTHGTKNKQHHAELYTKKRFIALTGNLYDTTANDVLRDATAQLWATAFSYFPKTVAELAEAEWTTTDDPACTITGTDDERIAYGLKMKSVAARFGEGNGKATFADLWNCNVDVLSRTWRGNDGDQYDASSADQALANGLIYLFAGNCEKVLTIMLEHPDCKLRREKWNRPDYLRNRTIPKAAALPHRWPKKRPTATVIEPELTAPPPPRADGTPAPPAKMPEVQVENINLIGGSHMPALFEGYVYVNDMNRIVGPDGFIMDSAKFDAHPRFAKKQYLMEASGKVTDSAWNAFIQSQLSPGVKVRGALFDPRLEPGAIVDREGVPYVNTWRPVNIEMIQGDVAPFTGHLTALFDDWRLLLNYLKFMVQHKGDKCMWWPFIYGIPGNGKSFINATMLYCIGRKFTESPKASNLDSNFNASLYGKLFLAVEDIKVAEDYAKIWETLKPMVTQEYLEIEPKGIDKVTREVCFNAILNSNHKVGIRKEPDDRRIAPFFSKQQRIGDLERDGLTEKYFDNLWAWAKNGGWARVAYYLANDPIDDSFSATKCPVTSSTAEHIMLSRSPAEQEILEAARGGVIGFKGGWLNLTKVNNLLDGKRYRASLAIRRAMVEGLGYIPHPGLPGGQVPTPLADNTMPLLFILPGHTTATLTDPAQIKTMYEAAQR